ncbi:MAG: alternate ATPase, subunit epsilon [Planctomycetaceae bacterium]|nr:alternate ATPase, subunit epsilon [Planctomycetaceae bacterium]
MHLKVLLPFQVFDDRSDIKRIVVETQEGSYGLLPQRLDCVAPLVPGILMFEPASGEEIYIAVDEGVLVKAGKNVLISVRNAIGGTDLGKLREAVEREFVNLDERERNVRSVLAKLESSFIRRFVEIKRV